MSSEESDIDDDERIVSAGNPELARRMESMRQEIQELREEKESMGQEIESLREQQQDTHQRAHQADGVAQTALEVANEKDEKIEDLRTENEELRERVEELEDANSIVAEVNDNRAMDPEDRAVACIQILARDAGSDGKASMSISDGWNALSRAYDRTRMYDVYRKAESLVDNDDVCWFQKEPRGHTPPSRLIIDRTDDDLPEKAAGKRLRGGSR